MAYMNIEDDTRTAAQEEIVSCRKNRSKFNDAHTNSIKVTNFSRLFYKRVRIRIYIFLCGFCIATQVSLEISLYYIILLAFTLCSHRIPCTIHTDLGRVCA